MTKEDRTKKWFSNIPDAELISMEIKMEICRKVAKKMKIIIFRAHFVIAVKWRQHSY